MTQPTPDGPKSLILGRLKALGALSASDLAGELKISRQAVRQHLLGLERSGSIRPASRAPRQRRSGRPERRYRLSDLAEDLFPKAYDQLAAEFIATLERRLGRPALEEILSAMADGRVKQWEPRLKGKTFEERLELLKGIYKDSDSFMSVERRAGGVRLIERNCPFYNVAQEHPALCSLTVSVLSRLLGRRIEREERFQNGDGRCAFRVLSEQLPQPPPRFEFEPPSDAQVPA